MCYRLASFALVCLITGSIANAQSTQAAQGYFDRGSQRYLKGDIEGAISVFTLVIELSSRLERNIPSTPTGGLRVPISTGASGERQIRAIDPLTASAYTNRALARTSLRDYDGAISDCNRALSIDPRLYQALNNRGVALFHKGEFTQALLDLDRAISFDQSSPEPFNNRGNVRRETGDLIGAISDYTRALELNPKSAEVYCNRGFVRFDSRQNDTALEDFEKALSLDGRMAWAYYGKGSAHVLKTNYDIALDAFSQAIRIDPKLACAYGDRGLAALRLWMDLEAEIDFEQCLAISPDLKDVLEAQISRILTLRSSAGASKQERGNATLDRLPRPVRQ